MGKTLIMVVVLFAVWPVQLQAAAPAPLRGKSITVAWTENRVQRIVGESDFRSVAVQHRYQVYVGANGRVFSRMTNVNRRGKSGSREEVGGEQGNRWTPSFSGRAMTVMMGGRGGGGARRVAVEFGTDFSSCSANAVRAKEVGAASMISGSTIFPGRRVEIKSVATAGVTCQIQSGNVFGTE